MLRKQAGNLVALPPQVNRNTLDHQACETVGKVARDIQSSGLDKFTFSFVASLWEDLNGEVTFSLPAGPFAWLTPTDCLGLSLRGGLYRIRVEGGELQIEV